MKKREGYIFTNKRHSNRGVMATVLGVISLGSLAAVVFLAYVGEGAATVGYGFTGLLATLFSIVGLCLGLVTVRDGNYYKLFPVLGILLNLAALGGASLILYVGANL